MLFSNQVESCHETIKGTFKYYINERKVGGGKSTDDSVVTKLRGVCIPLCGNIPPYGDSV